MKAILRDPKLRRALGLAVLAGVFTFVYIQWQRAAIRADGLPVTIYVAQRHIPKHTQIRGEHLAAIERPQQFVPRAAYRDRQSLLGQVTTTGIDAGEVFTTTRVTTPTASGAIASVVPPGKRAVTIPVDLAQSVHGMIQPGDHVDLLGSFRSGTRDRHEQYVLTVLQAVEVLAVGKRIAGAGTPNAAGDTRAASLTVALSPEQTQSAFFTQAHGQVFVSLRSRGDTDVTARPAPATAAKVTGLTSLLPRREYRGR